MPNSTDAYLWIDGKPSAADEAWLRGNKFWQRVGSITVTIIPDPDSNRRTLR